MIDMLIVGSACMLGYMMTKDGKTARDANGNVVVSPNNLPCGPLIYESNRVRQVDEYVRDLAASKHAEKVKMNFPLDYDKPIEILPESINGEMGAPINLFSIEKQDDRYANNVNISLTTNPNTAAYDPESSRPFVATQTNITSSPMFRQDFLSGNTSSPMNETSKPVSLLTGLPIDMSHANMQPMFGGMVKQAAVTNDNSQVLLEHYTGMPSTDDQGTYRQKQEVIKPFPTNPDFIKRPDLAQVTDAHERIQSALKPSNEFVTPVKSFRDLPLNADALRFLPLDANGTRGVNKKQVTYEGVMIPGQKGSSRAMLPKIKDPRWDLLKETSSHDLVANRSITASTKIAQPQVRNLLKTQVFKSSYRAPPTNQKSIYDIGANVERFRNQESARVSRMMEPTEGGFGPASGKKQAASSGILMVKDPNKGTENNYIQQPNQGTMGSRLRNVSEPKSTMKELLTDATTGAVNPTGAKDNRAWQKQDIKLEVTAKALQADNPYRGLPKYNMGMGGRKHDIQNFTSSKDMNQFSHTGIAKNATVAHMSYESVFENDANKELYTDRYGIAKGPINAKVSDGGEIVADMEKLLVRDYVNLPKGMAKGRNRKEFEDGLTIENSRIEFGGHYNGANPSTGIGENANRTAAYRSKKESTVLGRMNIGLQKDKFTEHMGLEMNLRPDKDQTDVRQLVQRTQPLAVVTDRMPVLIKSRNVEALNPRMDEGVRITNDLYPWIKDKGEDDDEKPALDPVTITITNEI